MDRKLFLFGFCLAAFAMSAAAQTNVTNNNDGTANTVPVYTGTATLGNSPISVSGGNVGIGTGSSNPTAQLQVLSNSNTSGWWPVANLGIGNNPGATDYTQLMIGQINTGIMFLDVMNQVNTKGSLAISPWGGGKVGIGTTNPGYTLDVSGQIHATQAINASGGVTFPDGTTQTTAFNSTLCGGDYAESMDATGIRARYSPGDVLILDAQNPGKVLKSTEPYSTAVAGIYSTRPGTVGRRQMTPKSADEVPMAMVGVVPTKVTAENGPIRVGDLLVSSSTPGYAMKGTDRERMLGSVIGKAMGPLESGTGTIEVLVTLQ
jgi:hypothetical protein